MSEQIGSGKTLREMIIERMEELEVTTYALARAPGITSNPSTVNRFISEGRNTSSEAVAEMMAALGGSVVWSKKKPAWISK